MEMQSKTELVAEAIKATPPAVVAGMTVAGASLNDIVLVATLVYITLQIGFLLFKWYRLHQHSKLNSDSE
jgi:hypothetical protein